jgi:hypothetical protein
MNKQIKESIKELKEISSWLVCYSITTPKDMARSFEEMYIKLENAIYDLEHIK